MAAPATTVRQTPGGFRLTDGHPTKIAFERDPDAEFFEVSVTPPGMETEDGIDITTMWNEVFETFDVPALARGTEVSVTAGYDPVIMTQAKILNLKENGSITVTKRDGTTVSFFGYLKSAIPQEMTRNEMPLIELTIFVTNYDPVNKVEAGWVVTSVAGT